MRASGRGILRIVFLLAGVLWLGPVPCVWAHTDVTPVEARELIDSTADLVVVDVREPSEYCDAVGHVPGALNYPLNSGALQARYAELPTDAPILVVCRSGGAQQRGRQLPR
jgi:rhodanese-related sulfurtransferase